MFYRLSRSLFGVCVFMAVLAMLLMPLAQAQVAINLSDAQGRAVPVTAKNATRVDDALILFDANYGATTRTNPYGVEVIAKPAAKAGEYEVLSVTSIWECQKAGDEGRCGNAAIPEKGLVLSASGDKRQALLQGFQPGQHFAVNEEWFQRTTAPLSAVNPTALTNPLASGFPGFRGGNQLILYDSSYGEPTTGTNEFGFEVTVENGVVTAQEGSDSKIPANGFVLSGHGKMRSWLIANAPIGARMMRHEDGHEITSLVNFDTYAYQLDHRLADSPCKFPDKAQKIGTCRMVERARHDAERLYAQGQADVATSMLAHSLEDLNRLIWTQYPAFPNTAIKAAWHRPIEKNATDIAQTLDRLQKAGLNTVFLETFFHGYTIFPSETFRAYGLPVENPKFNNVDLLKIWVTEAHARGMQIHPWFQAFYAGTNAYLPPGPILSKYPEWTNVQYSSLDMSKRAQLKLTPSTLELGAYFLDPANPEVQNFVAKLAEEIVTRYDVDGLQLDYIRYPASFPVDRFSYHKTTWGYTPIARARFQGQYGVDPIDLDPKKPEDAQLWQSWSDYKTAQVSNFVHRVSDRLHAVRPKLQLSAAVFPERESAIVKKHQDWATWANNGWVDFLAPMTLTSSTKVVEQNTEYMLKTINYSMPVYSGVFGPFNNNSAEMLLEQIDAARKAGAGGFAIFDTAHLTGRMMQALQAAQTISKVDAEDPAVILTQPAKTQPVIPAQAQPKKKRRWFRLGK